MLLGWNRTYRRLQETRREVVVMSGRLGNIESSILELYTPPAPHHSDASVTHLRIFSGTNLNGCNLSGMTIRSTGPEFQSVSLEDANLEDADISVSSSSFQKATFDRANLKHAKLSASGSAFQYVTFVGADLTGATLSSGTGADFQVVSFRDANLKGATIVCGGSSAFSTVDINNANFEDANLSSINADNLASSYFVSPPLYSNKTQFPSGFSPVDCGWRLVKD
jgi:hypothetical protein